MSNFDILRDSGDAGRAQALSSAAHVPNRFPLLPSRHYAIARASSKAQDFLTLHPNRAAPHRVRDALGLLVRLVLIGDFVKVDELNRWVPAPALEASGASGLIARSPAQVEDWSASRRYSVNGLYIMPDRHSNPDSATITAAPDVVQEFMRSLPADPCDRCLDLCSGSGNAALAAAGYASRAWSLDVAESSAHLRQTPRHAERCRESYSLR
jgi:hypothetical protein